jgi:hypothetical protein
MPELNYGEHGNTPGPESVAGSWAPRPEHREGPVARAIERQTAKLPSDTFLWIAVGSMIGSAVMQATGRKHISLFIGQWAPTLLLLGLYNKLVKVAGSH